jgi:hypothetical protein
MPEQITRKARVGRAAATLGVLLLLAKLALGLYGMPSPGSRTLIFAGVVFLFVGLALIQHDKRSGPNGEARDS